MGSSNKYCNISDFATNDKDDIQGNTPATRYANRFSASANKDNKDSLDSSGGFDTQNSQDYMENEISSTNDAGTNDASRNGVGNDAGNIRGIGDAGNIGNVNNTDIAGGADTMDGMGSTSATTANASAADDANGNSKSHPTDKATSVVYDLELLSTKRPGPVLAVGYGNPLKTVVRAANNYGVTPLFTTGTNDKFRAFTFGGTSTTISIGEKFDDRLFTNEFAVLQAAKECGAKTILCSTNAMPSMLLAKECTRLGILLLVPVPNDRTLLHWRRAWDSDIPTAYNGSDVPSGITASALVPHGEIAPAKWRKCARCGFTNSEDTVIANGWSCPTCGKLIRLDSSERIALTFDAGSVELWDTDVEQTDALDFPDFDKIIARAQERSGHDEGVVTGKAKICGLPVAFGIMESSFMMASMGHVVGEKVTRMFERATEERLPVVIFNASGGARMQEGLVSLMQMAKVSAAVEMHSAQGLLYISVFTDPTTGGVTASFAMLGDIILAEPHAIIGFAGRRVIQNTIKKTLPDDFQSAEFALEHGLIDAIVERSDMRSALGKLLSLHTGVACDCGDGDGDGTDDGAGDGDGADVGDNVNADGNNIGNDSHDSSADDGANESINDGDDDGDNAGDGSSGAPSEESQPSDPLAFITRELQGMAASVGAAASKQAASLGAVLTEQADRAALWWALRNKGVADYPYIKPASNTPTPPNPFGGFAAKDSASESQSSNDSQGRHAWESVQLARNVNRPTAKFYIDALVDDFFELHGDREFADDGAIIGGIGRIGEYTVTIIAEEKGTDLKSKIVRNFGCPLPEGYRKAMRLMREAEKFNRPIVCLVDTQGAFCGEEAEERGIGGAIAESLSLAFELHVPIVSAIIGEGGSGGALALAVGNRVGMQENAVYSVLSPEGFASILWKDGSRAHEAADVMRLSASDSLEMGIIEDIIPEGSGPAHENPDQAAVALWVFITNALDELSKLSDEELTKERYARFRKY